MGKYEHINENLRQIAVMDKVIWSLVFVLTVGDMYHRITYMWLGCDTMCVGYTFTAHVILLEVTK